MQMSESILFIRHLVAGNYMAAFKLTGIEWDVTDFNCPESQIFNDSDLRFYKKIIDFFKENSFLFDEYDESIKNGFKAYIPQYLLEHPVRKMLLEVMKIKAIAVPPAPIKIDLSLLSAEQVEMLQSAMQTMPLQPTLTMDDLPRLSKKQIKKIRKELKEAADKPVAKTNDLYEITSLAMKWREGKAHD